MPILLPSFSAMIESVRSVQLLALNLGILFCVQGAGRHPAHDGERGSGERLEASAEEVRVGGEEFGEHLAKLFGGECR